MLSMSQSDSGGSSTPAEIRVATVRMEDTPGTDDCNLWRFGNITRNTPPFIGFFYPPAHQLQTRHPYKAQLEQLVN